MALAAPLFLETATAQGPAETTLATANCLIVQWSTSPPNVWVDPDCLGIPSR